MITILGYQKIRRGLEASARDGRLLADNEEIQAIRQGLREGHLKPEDFSFKLMFQYWVPDGFELLEEIGPNRVNKLNLALLRESGSAVDTSAFANISGQLMITQVLKGYQQPEFIGDRLVTVVPTTLNGEKIPGVTDLGDVVQEVKENHEYPTAGVGEVWIETPETVKRGIIVPLTNEAIFFDRTGLVLRQASLVGKALGINREKRILDCVLGITQTYRRNGGAAQATYGDTHTNGSFDNLAASNALVNWQSFDTMDQLFNGIVDPDTEEPISVMPKQTIVPKALENTAKMIMNATAVTTGSGAAFTADPTDNPQFQTQSKNPVNPREVLSSVYVKNRTGSDTTWFDGDFPEAFHYMQNWPAQVIQAPTNSHDEFHRDVAYQWKVTERGVCACVEPRVVAKATA